MRSSITFSKLPAPNLKQCSENSFSNWF